MRRIILSLIVMGGMVVFVPDIAQAASLQIAPTLYKDVVLKKGEKKKAFVDVSNPIASTQDVKLTVKRFKQVDDSGTLSFFEDESVAKGVALDLDNFSLNPRDTIRVFFELDGAKLPSGDIFIAIFASTVPSQELVAQAVQVGTLLTITNGTPASRVAEISHLSVPFFQWGEALSAEIVVKNPALESSATGFFPSLSISARPYAERTVEGPLVFAGRERSIEYTQKGDYIGFIHLFVRTNGDDSGRWLIAVTGFWRWLIPTLVLLLLASLFLWRIKRSQPRHERP